MGLMCIKRLVAIKKAEYAFFFLCEKKKKKFGGIKNIAYFCIRKVASRQFKQA